MAIARVFAQVQTTALQCLLCLVTWHATLLCAEPRAFDIPGQSLDSALLSFSRQSGLQLFYRAQLVEGIGSQPVSGEWEPEQALQQLLANTGVRFRFLDEHTLTLQRDTPSTAEQQRPTITEEVRVLGSYLRHGAQSGQPAPISVLERHHFDIRQPAVLSDLTLDLPFSSGAEVRIDNLSRPLTVGTATVNLRNLGLDSTMVLVDGYRQALAPVATTEGETFVDLNSLMPAIMLDRIEILRGGGSSTYGSDAVAGVVNLLPRYAFNGLELNATHTQTSDGDQADQQLQLLVGSSFAEERGHGVFAFSTLHRSALETQERGFTRGSAISSAGQPGTYVGSGAPIRDPACAHAGLIEADNAFCLFDASPYFDLLPEQDLWQLFGSVDWQFNPQWQLRWGLAMTDNQLSIRASPSFPFGTELPVVPVGNPGNLSDEPLRFHGRVFGADTPASVSSSHYQYLSHYLTVRYQHLGWQWEGRLSYGANQVRYGRADVVRTRLQAALDGVGGADGQQTWNPLYQADNPAGLAESFFADSDMHGDTRLLSTDLIVNSPWFPWRQLNYATAIGVHFRQEKLANRFSQAFNEEQFYTLGGGPDFAGERSARSLFAELYLDWDEQWELQLAARYEDYGTALDSLAPMLGLSWHASDSTSFRASFNRAFRAPSLFQSMAIQSVTRPVFDPLHPNGAAFRNVVTNGSRHLSPETANVFNIGFSMWLPSGFSQHLDLWHYDYQRLILKESAQKIVDAALDGNAAAAAKVIRDPLSGEILRINAEFVNAGSIVTQGIDWQLNAAWQDRLARRWQAGLSATYVHRFDIEEQVGEPGINGLSSRNATTPAANSLPQWQLGSFIEGQTGPHRLRAALRYVDNYQDDLQGNPISSYTTVDLYYEHTLQGVDRDLVLSASLINLLDRMPPHVDDFLGYDPLSHDPRGRVLTLGATLRY